MTLYIFTHIMHIKYTFISGKVHFDVRYMPGTGNFEIQEGGTLVASGKITCPENTGFSQDETDFDFTNEDFEMKSADIYKELRLRGYDYGPTFQGIKEADITGIFIIKLYPSFMSNNSVFLPVLIL